MEGILRPSFNDTVNPLGGGGRGGLLNLVKIMVSVLHKPLESKVEKLKCKKLEDMQSRIKNKSKLLAGE